VNSNESSIDRAFATSNGGGSVVSAEASPELGAPLSDFGGVVSGAWKLFRIRTEVALGD